MFNRNDFINWANSASDKNTVMSDFKRSYRNPTKQLLVNENTEPVVVSPTKAAKTLDNKDDQSKLASKKTALSLGIKLASGKIIPKQVDDYEYENLETELEREVNEEVEINEIGLAGTSLIGAGIGGGLALGKKILRFQRRGQDARATASHDMYGGTQNRPYNFGDKRREQGNAEKMKKYQASKSDDQPDAGTPGTPGAPTRVSLSKGGGSTDPKKPGVYTTKDQDKLAQISSLSSGYDPQGTELAEGLISGAMKLGAAGLAGYAAYKGAGALMNRFAHKRAVANTKQSAGSPSTPPGSEAQSGMSKLANMIGSNKTATDKIGQIGRSAGKAIAGSDTVKSLKKDVGGLALRGGRKLATSGAGGKIGSWASKALGAAGSALRKSARG